MGFPNPSNNSYTNPNTGLEYLKNDDGVWQHSTPPVPDAIPIEDPLFIFARGEGSINLRVSEEESDYNLTKPFKCKGNYVYADGSAISHKPTPKYRLDPTLSSNDQYQIMTNGMLHRAFIRVFQEVWDYMDDNDASYNQTVYMMPYYIEEYLSDVMDDIEDFIKSFDILSGDLMRYQMEDDDQQRKFFEYDVWFESLKKDFDEVMS